MACAARLLLRLTVSSAANIFFFPRGNIRKQWAYPPATYPCNYQQAAEFEVC
jgi:hypothetical protein